MFLVLIAPRSAPSHLRLAMAKMDLGGASSKTVKTPGIVQWQLEKDLFLPDSGLRLIEMNPIWPVHLRKRRLQLIDLLNDVPHEAMKQRRVEEDEQLASAAVAQIRCQQHCIRTRLASERGRSPLVSPLCRKPARPPSSEPEFLPPKSELLRST